MASEKFKAHIRKYYHKNRKYICARRIKYHKQNLKNWVGFIPIKTKCQICKKEIYFNRPDIKKPICFDHRHGGKEKINKKSPILWLSQYPRNNKNEKIWKSCDFGMLCRKCNSYLPIKNRKQYIKNLNKYVFGKEKL